MNNLCVRYVKQIINLFPTLTPIDGRTWFKKFYRLSMVNFLLSTYLMVLMILNTKILGIFLFNFLFFGAFTFLLVNDVNFFIIFMERLLDADINPFIVFPLFFTLLFVSYIMKLIIAQIIAASSIIVGVD